jgi:hypothetical protein
MAPMQHWLVAWLPACAYDAGAAGTGGCGGVEAGAASAAGCGAGGVGDDGDDFGSRLSFMMGIRTDWVG